MRGPPRTTASSSAALAEPEDLPGKIGAWVKEQSQGWEWLWAGCSNEDQYRPPAGLSQAPSYPRAGAYPVFGGPPVAAVAAGPRVRCSATSSLVDDDVELMVREECDRCRDLAEKYRIVRLSTGKYLLGGPVVEVVIEKGELLVRHEGRVVKFWEFLAGERGGRLEAGTGEAGQANEPPAATTNRSRNPPTTQLLESFVSDFENQVPMSQVLKSCAEKEDATAPAPKAPQPVALGSLVVQPEESVDPADLHVFEQCLGSGTFGTVFRGALGTQPVAVKQLNVALDGEGNADQKLQFRREFHAMSSLSYKHLVRFFGVCARGRHCCLVMELASGGSLHELLRGKTVVKVTLPERMRLSQETCLGVAFLHDQLPGFSRGSAVIHRDLKPMNVLLDGPAEGFHGTVKLCDFGMTAPLENTHLTVAAHDNGGSPRYMAPEAYEAPGIITEKVDIWALGLIIHEIFGGDVPYADCTAMQQIVVKVAVKKEPPVISAPLLPSDLREQIKICCTFNVRERPTGWEMYEACKL